jgi:DNA (cytosine-5)-methyltransferase 1
VGSRSPTVRAAIGDLPSPEPLAKYIDWHALPYSAAERSTFALRMLDLDRDPEDLSFHRVWNRDLCTNVAPTIHGDEVRSRFEKLEYGAVDRVSGLARLHPDRVAHTIRAGTEADRGSRSAPRPIHPFEPRVLTTRECARLQTFPDWFLFHPVKWHGNRQVGNAVPPLLARKLGSEILRRLGIQAPAQPLVRVQRDGTLVAQDKGYRFAVPMAEAS